MSEGTKKALTAVGVVLALVAVAVLVPPIREYFLQGFRDIGILEQPPIE